jgi:hypothetical protein
MGQENSAGDWVEERRNEEKLQENHLERLGCLLEIGHLQCSSGWSHIVQKERGCGLLGENRCVSSHNAFSPSLNLTCGDAISGSDVDGKSYIRLDLPSTKTAKPGETQHIYLVEQGDLCPILALHNLATVIPASASDPLFSWHDNHRDICPLSQSAALSCINNIISAWG